MSPKTVPTPQIHDKPERKRRPPVRVARSKAHCTCRECLAREIAETRRQHADQQVSA